MADIDQALTRLFSARYRNGDLAGASGRRPADGSPVGTDSPAHRDLARIAAEKSLVLLKNDGVLPLKPGLKIVVIGPHADSTRVLRGNYSSALSAPPVSLVEGMRAAIPGARIVQIPFQPTIMDGDPIPASALRTPGGKPGLQAEYFNGSPGGGSTPAQVQAVTYERTPVLRRVEPGAGARGYDSAQVEED